MGWRVNRVVGILRIVLLLAVLGTLAAAVGQVAARGPAVVQPIAFNHKKHHDAQIPCTTCHVRVEEAPNAGRPSLETCATCHSAALGDSAEEKKVVDAVTAGHEIRWRRLYRIPSHVYYSHRRHVVTAGIECVTCHGEIGLRESPPERPLNRLTMSFCIDCHRRSNAATHCTACHR